MFIEWGDKTASIYRGTFEGARSIEVLYSSCIQKFLDYINCSTVSLSCIGYCMIKICKVGYCNPVSPIRKTKKLLRYFFVFLTKMFKLELDYPRTTMLNVKPIVRKFQQMVNT